MIPAKLIKDLERIGFQLDFPAYSSNEERIVEILKTNNQRLYLAIPLLLEHFDYDAIINGLSSIDAGKLIEQFNKILLIADKIFILENLDNHDIQNAIDRHSLKISINDEEFKYYYDSFKDFSRRTADIKEEKLKENIKLRSKLNTNKSLSKIFSPAKIMIMEKIFNHEKLTNTELKYYYRSIRPIIQSILNESMVQYLRIIESSKKNH